MNEDEVVDIIRAFIEGLFPKDCAVCGHRFHSLKEYLEKTGHSGDPVSYDAEMKNWKPVMPFGTYSFAKCECGNTLAVDNTGMPFMTQWRLLAWARKETKYRGISVNELLSRLREKIDRKVMSG